MFGGVYRTIDMFHSGAAPGIDWVRPTEARDDADPALRQYVDPQRAFSDNDTRRGVSARPVGAEVPVFVRIAGIYPIHRDEMLHPALQGDNGLIDVAFLQRDGVYN